MPACCCHCGAYEYIHRDRSFHRFPKNQELRGKWLAAVGRTEIYATAKLCSNHFDYDDFNNDRYNTRRTLLPGVVPHRNLEKKIRRDLGLICNQIEFNKTVESVNKNVETLNNTEIINNNDAELAINNNNTKLTDGSRVLEDTNIINAEELLVINNKVEVIIVDTELVNNNTDHEETIVIISSGEENINCVDNNVVNNEDGKTNHSIKTEEISSPKRILKKINISNIKKIKLELLNKNTFLMTRRNFTSDEAWYAFALNQILKRQRNKILQAKNKRLKNKVLNLQNILKILRHKNYVSKSGADKIQEIVPPEVQEMLQIMLTQKKSMKFSEELKSFATTLHYYSPSGYEYVRNTFIKCLPHVSTLGKPRQGSNSYQGGNNLQENSKSKNQKKLSN